MSVLRDIAMRSCSHLQKKEKAVQDKIFEDNIVRLYIQEGKPEYGTSSFGDEHKLQLDIMKAAVELAHKQNCSKVVVLGSPIFQLMFNIDIKPQQVPADRPVIMIGSTYNIEYYVNMYAHFDDRKVIVATEDVKEELFSRKYLEL